MKDNAQWLKNNMASCLAKYLGWKEADFRDAGAKVLQRFSDEGWAWDDTLLCWRKVGTLTGEVTKL